MMVPGSFGCCGGFGAFGAYGWIGLVINALVIGAVIWLVVWAVRRLSTGGANAFLNRPDTEQSARDVLRTRYARGEITREQYLEMLRDLD